MKKPEEYLTEGQEFDVQKDWSVSSAGVSIRIDSISEDGYVTVSNDGAGPSESDVPKERLIARIDDGTLRPRR